MKPHPLTSFYPGPSRVYDKIPAYVKDAHKSGLLSLNHRSPEFEALSKKTVTLLKQRLKIPKDFVVVFASSATECWEMIAQSVVAMRSIHLYNGAFGEKWFDYTRRIVPNAKGIPFEVSSLPTLSDLIFDSGDVICLTQNETSNGTQLSSELIDTIRLNNPNHLVAVDATSSMAGIRLDFKAADIWFASVQKCFGLPAGLAVMVISKRGQETIQRIQENRHYNSLTFVTSMMAKWQTSCTPNVLGIYLLMRSLQDTPSVGTIHKQTKERADRWHELLSESKTLKSFASNPSTRSLTVITVVGEPVLISKIKKEARKNGFLLGEGYGPLKKDTFRIANFPALKKQEIQALMRFLSRF